MFPSGVALRLAAAVPRLEGGQAHSVEAPDQQGHGITALPSSQESGLGVAVPVGHRQEGFGSGNQGRGFGLRTTEPLELCTLLSRERAERIDLATRHPEAPL